MEKNILIVILTLLISMAFDLDLLTTYGMIGFMICVNEIVFWLLERIFTQKEKDLSHPDKIN